MRPQSAKAKGRRLQQYVAKRIQETFGLPASDVKSLPMGAPGEDIWLSRDARQKFPFSVECKNVEKLNVAQAFEQANTNAIVVPPYETFHAPLLVHTKNRGRVLATLELDELLRLLKR